jgi:hypothetical protein
MMRAEAKGKLELSDRQLRRLLPPEAKHSEKIRSHSPSHSKSKVLVKPTLHLVKPESEPDKPDKPEQSADIMTAKPELESQLQLQPQPQPEAESIREQEQEQEVSATSQPVTQVESQSQSQSEQQVTLKKVDLVDYDINNLEKYDRKTLGFYWR